MMMSQSLDGAIGCGASSAPVFVDFEFVVEGLKVVQTASALELRPGIASGPYGAALAPKHINTIQRRVVLRTLDSNSLVDVIALDESIREALIELGGDHTRKFDRLYHDYQLNDDLLRRLLACATAPPSRHQQIVRSSAVPLPAFGRPITITVRMRDYVVPQPSSERPLVVAAPMGAPQPSALPSAAALQLKAVAARPTPPVGLTASALSSPSLAALSHGGYATSLASNGSAAAPRRTILFPTPSVTSRASTAASSSSSLRSTPVLHTSQRRPPPMDSTCYFCRYDLDAAGELARLRHHITANARTTVDDGALDDGVLRAAFADGRPPARGGGTTPEQRLYASNTVYDEVAKRTYRVHPRCAHVCTEYQRSEGSIDDLMVLGGRPQCAWCKKPEALVHCYEPSCKLAYCIPCALFVEGTVDFGYHDPVNPVPACPRHTYTPAPGSTLLKRNRGEKEGASLFDSSKSASRAIDPDDP